ncbi:hypothetical protein ACFCV4_12450 [Enterococcus faecium]|uniref:hypothetical protein n=1 Tax=Enterococcus TaxID=1350 RepID=UPI000A352AB6|nr:MULTISPECIES: hypothetical protein [Enterococcus]MDK4461924.1 hypothetical protein [Enterococcus faecium]MDT2326642.1 hypothetical protein [Enterococcus faecium]MDT2348436.1 hypothetical protein [Enterococcus faecium]MDV7815878.1 hypothetical protein [Enterococcus hirae]MDW3698701.1 hypothetical protein [Enterococcus faecium]
MYDFLMGLFVFTFLVVIILVILLIVFWILKLKSNMTNDLSLSKEKNNLRFKKSLKYLKFSVLFWILLIILMMIVTPSLESSESASVSQQNSSQSTSMTSTSNSSVEKEDTTVKDANNQEEKRSLANSIVANLTAMPSENDTMTDTVWFYNSYLENYTNRYQLYPYISTSEDALNPDKYLSNVNLPSINGYMRVSYEGDDWLFVRGDIEIKTDNNKYTIPTNSSDWKRDNNSRVWEWNNLRIESTSILKDIANSNQTIVRLNGRQYYDDRELSQPEKDAINQVVTVLDAYSKLKSLN